MIIRVRVVLSRTVVDSGQGALAKTAWTATRTSKKQLVC